MNKDKNNAGENSEVDNFVDGSNEEVKTKVTLEVDEVKKKLHIGWWVLTFIVTIGFAVGSFFAFFQWVFAMVCLTLAEQVAYGAIMFLVPVVYGLYFVLVPKGSKLKMFLFSVLLVVITILIGIGCLFI